MKTISKASLGPRLFPSALCRIHTHSLMLFVVRPSPYVPQSKSKCDDILSPSSYPISYSPTHSFHRCCCIALFVCAPICHVVAIAGQTLPISLCTHTQTHIHIVVVVLVVVVATVGHCHCWLCGIKLFWIQSLQLFLNI